MQLKASDRSEKTEQPFVNLASLLHNIAIDSSAVSAVFPDLWANWMNSNVPNACGQSEDEFGELVNSMMGEFEAGVNESIESKFGDPLTMQIEHFLSLSSSRAWRIYTMLAFMVRALPEDRADAMPIHCTLVALRNDIENLAQCLMDLEWRARHV